MSLDSVAGAIDFDHTDPAQAQRLYPILAEQRESCPVLHGSRFGGFWALTRHADVVVAADDPTHFTTTQGITIPPLGLPVMSVPLTLDPPRHGKYRRVLQPHFTAPAARALEPRIREVIAGCVAAFADRGSADLVRDLARPVPPIIIAEILGVDPARAADLKRWTDEMTEASHREDMAANRLASQGMLALLHEELRRRREEPTDDLLSTIAHCEIEGEEVTEDERLGMVEILLVAGHETTVQGIGNTLHRLLEEPDLVPRILAEEALFEQFIDESLRYEAPVFGLARTVVSDVEVSGQLLQAGERVLVMFGSANHDPRVFEEPDAFIPDRARNPHVSFGYGRHRCLGEHLARLEIRIAIEELFTRIPGLRLAPDAEITMKAGLTRGPKALPVVW